MRQVMGRVEVTGGLTSSPLLWDAAVVMKRAKSIIAKKHNPNHNVVDDPPMLSWNDVRDEFHDDPGAVADLRAALAPVPLSEITTIITILPNKQWLERVRRRINTPRALYGLEYYD